MRTGETSTISWFLELHAKNRNKSRIPASGAAHSVPAPARRSENHPPSNLRPQAASQGYRLAAERPVRGVPSLHTRGGGCAPLPSRSPILAWLRSCTGSPGHPVDRLVVAELLSRRSAIARVVRLQPV